MANRLKSGLASEELGQFILEHYGLPAAEVIPTRESATTLSVGKKATDYVSASHRVKRPCVRWVREQMSFKPDFGLRLKTDGISRDVDQYFYDFRLWSLTVLGRGQYSTGVEMPLAGELHALSLDFNQGLSP